VRTGTPGLQALAAIVGLAAFVVAAVLWSRGATGTTSLRAIAPVLPWAGAVAMWLVVWLRWRQRTLAVTAALTVLVASAAFARGTGALGEVGPGATTGPPLSSAEIPAVPSGSSALNASSEPAAASPSAASEEATPENPSPVQIAVTWTSAQMAAAEWLAEHASADDVVLVSRTEEAMLPAVTGLRTYISGASYQNFYGTRPASDFIFHRVRVSARFPAKSTPDDLAELCQERVTWAFVEPGTTESSGATVAFANEGATVMRLDRTGCP